MSDDTTLSELDIVQRGEPTDPEQLHVDGENPNEQSDDAFGSLIDGIQSGWVGGDIVVNTGALPGYEGDPDGLICDGEHRWRAAQEIGRDTVPVTFVDFESDAQRRYWRQHLNKVTGEHDSKRDALEYDVLLSAGMSEEVDALTDAADEDLDELLEEIRVDTAQPAEYEYDLDHEVYFEDCVDGMAERLPDGAADCVITDPPYGIDVDLTDTLGSRNVDHVGDLENDGLEDALALFEETAAELHRVLADDGHAYVFASWKTYDEFRDILLANGFDVKNCIVWCKTTPNNQPNFGTGGVNYGTQHEFILYATKADGAPRPLAETMSDLIRHKHQTEGNEHPTEKPVGLIETLLQQSTEPGERVLDPFMGSGTTAVAAVQNDREYAGFEVDEENYREVIERRVGEAERQREAAVNQEADAETAAADD